MLLICVCVLMESKRPDAYEDNVRVSERVAALNAVVEQERLARLDRLRQRLKNKPLMDNVVPGQVSKPTDGSGEGYMFRLKCLDGSSLDVLIPRATVAQAYEEELKAKRLAAGPRWDALNVTEKAHRVEWAVCDECEQVDWCLLRDWDLNTLKMKLCEPCWGTCWMKAGLQLHPINPDASLRDWKYIC